MCPRFVIHSSYVYPLARIAPSLVVVASYYSSESAMAKSNPPSLVVVAAIPHGADAGCVSGQLRDLLRNLWQRQT
jgi:hypothetical protein